MYLPGVLGTCTTFWLMYSWQGVHIVLCNDVRRDRPRNLTPGAAMYKNEMHAVPLGKGLQTVNSHSIRPATELV